MKTMNRNTAFAFVLLFIATITSASATVVTSQISYKTLGLAHTSWLVDANATDLSTTTASVTQDDLPVISNGGPYRTFMFLNASTESNGVMETSAGLRAGGQATSTSIWKDTIINNSGASNNYSMNVALTNLFFTSGGLTDNTAGREFLTGYTADVLVDGVSVWSSAQTLQHVGNNANIVKSGFDIGNGALNSSCSANGYGCLVDFSLNDYFGLVNLGTFNNGQKFDVSYVLSSFSYWDDPNGCAYECAFAEAYANDPFVVNGNRIVSGIGNVPEPGTIVSILAGLALMGLMMRRRRL